MDKIIVRGGRPLQGTVRVHGAKNAVLPILAAGLLASDGDLIIEDVPKLDDVATMMELLQSLGAHVEEHNGECLIRADKFLGYKAPYEIVRRMRASFLVVGPLLSRFGRAHVALPGGCAIGTRPIDQHLKGFEALGATIHFGQGAVEATVRGRLKGTKIYLDVPSVGATENIMMAAALAEGTTMIENAAEEPEIVDLANCLNAMGAKIRGAGTGSIRVEGVEALHGCRHQVIPDRIEAGTFLVAAAATGGAVEVVGAIADHLKPVIAKMTEMGVMLEERDNSIFVKSSFPLKSVDLKTLPYPGFPTDMQAQMMALLMLAKGTSVVTETVFENRFMHVEEFKRMNGRIRIDGRTAIVDGQCQLQGARVTATDLRAAAALIIAGLVASGETEVLGLNHLDRGYVDLVGKLRSLGADVERVYAHDELSEKVLS